MNKKIFKAEYFEKLCTYALSYHEKWTTGE